MHTGLADHARLMTTTTAGAGAAGCAACHKPPVPRLDKDASPRLSECVSCHSNHGVVRPTVALLAPLPPTPCAFCHESPESAAAAAVPEPEAKLRNYQLMRDSLLEQARGEKLEGPELFNWLVDRALELPTHTQAEGAEAKAELRPEFQRLFSKFRIGKTYYVYNDPATGKPARADVVRCTHCHASEAQGSGLKTGAGLLGRMRELTALTARAERILLEARRGGVETREALLALDHAVDAQIELEVLVHSFASAEDSPFAKKHREGVVQARSALDAGQKALEELDHRHRGLRVSLVLVALVLAGLALKIRQLGSGEPER
jgi:cytochrome c553